MLGYILMCYEGERLAPQVVQKGYVRSAQGAGPCGPKDCSIALRAMSFKYEVGVTGFAALHSYSK